MGFRENFAWGVATSSYQIEGASGAGGRGRSIWDDFCALPGRVQDGRSGAVACDHYYRYKEDVQLMKSLGVRAYRFSISWPRVLPEGIGAPNEEGLAFYSALVDELLAAGITPYATLFHWDMPSSLHEKGGWLSPESPSWFAGFTKLVAGRLGDRVKHFMTFNEPQCFVGISTWGTVQAPGIAFSPKNNLQMIHHVLLAHGMAVQALRSMVPSCRVGYAPTGTTYYPVTESPQDVEAARKAMFAILNWEEFPFCVSWYSDPVMLGRYPEDGLALFEGILPPIGPRDMATICQPLDFYGQNIYHSRPVQSDGSGGFQAVERPAGYPRTANFWPITPESLYWPIRFLYERYQVPIVITENGISCHDVVSLDGHVHDPNRIDMTHRYLKQLKRVVEDGVDVRGYFHWTLLDDFEWNSGYMERLGLVHVDFETQKRTPKDSFSWYRQVIATNGLGL